MILILYVFVGILISFIIYKLSKYTMLKEDEVIERWGTLLPGQAESGNVFLDSIDTELDRRNPSFSKGRIQYLEKLPTFSGQPAIKIKYDMTHSCYISYEAVGTDLHLSFVLLEKKSIFYAIPIFGTLLYHWFNVVYVHERNSLIAFTSVVMDCVKEITDELIDELGLDRASINVQAASGALGPL